MVNGSCVAVASSRHTHHRLDDGFGNDMRLDASDFESSGGIEKSIAVYRSGASDQYSNTSVSVESHSTE
jgi:hypothetical protein